MSHDIVLECSLFCWDVSGTAGQREERLLMTARDAIAGFSGVKGHGFDPSAAHARLHVCSNADAVNHQNMLTP